MNSSLGLHRDCDEETHRAASESPDSCPGLKQLLKVIVVSAAVCVCSGCFTSNDSGSFAKAIEPFPPVFLTGPVAGILTNAGAFSARIILSNDLRSPNKIAGELFVRDGKLLFAAEPGKKDKSHSGAFAYLYNLENPQSFVWSEALQGYARVSLHAVPTNLTISKGIGGLQKIDGHVCSTAEAVVKMSDGTSSNFQVMQALDLNRLPLRVNSLSTIPPFSVTLSKVHVGPPPADLFTPPSGFTEYKSPEMMVTELIMRQHNLRRPSGPSTSTDTLYDSRNRR